jgi:fructokinase
VILVAGETLIDRVVRLDGTTSDHPGGGPYNSARTIGRLGEPVRLISVLGTDEAAQTCLAGLRESGVDTSLVRTVDLTTTLAIATLNDSGAATYVFDFDISAARHLESLDIPADTSFLHVGTLALVLEPFATAVERAIATLPDVTVLLVDPNCRPSVVTDPAAFLAHVRADLARADVVKLSDDDLDFLQSLDAAFPGPHDFIAAGASCVLYTRGGSGVDVIGPWGTQTVPAPRVSVADTVGAGDSLSGAFVAWFSERKLGRSDLAGRDHVIAAVEFAVRVAAITVSRVGAEPPTRADLEAFGFDA